MRRMIQLVQAAKGAPVSREKEKTADSVAQRQRAVWHTTMQGLVSTGAHTHPPHYLLSYRQARLLAFFGKPCLDLSQLIHVGLLIYVFSALEVPVRPWTDARTTCPGPEYVWQTKTGKISAYHTPVTAAFPCTGLSSTGNGENLDGWNC